MPKILLLTRYERLGASSRVRFLQFLPALQRQGFEFDVDPLLDNAHVRALYGGPPVGVSHYAGAYTRRLRALLRRRRYDLIWLEKEALPWLPATVEAFLTGGLPVVVDFDDAWFLRYERNANPLIRHLMSGKIDAVMRAATIVVAGNDFIAERARQAGARRIEIVPSVIDLDRYPPPAAALPVDQRPVVAGWIGIPLNAHYLEALAGALRVVADRVRLHIVGAEAPAALAGLPVETFPWTEQSEISRIGAFDIGLMPLDDTPWERGKCAYKLLQVMAAGKPVIASPVGANRAAVRHEVNGLLAGTTEQWTHAFARLAGDPALRQRMGHEARGTVERDYSLTATLPKIAAILRDAALSR
jgi:glycosyltransferase involved in cell wall biosynthesis